MSVQAIDPDDLDRVVKLVADADRTLTFEAAAELLRTYRLAIVADAAACAQPAWQAALLTAANAGVRAVHGGVHVDLGADVVCAVPWSRGLPLSDALRAVGAEVTVAAGEVMDATTPTIVIGDRAAAGRGPAPVVRLSAGQWVARVDPGSGAPVVSDDGEPSVLAGVLAAAIAVSECFQWLRGHAVAGDRSVRVSLWDPDGRSDGPPIRDLPSALWLLGLGHLGQAYAWLLSLLPYPTDGVRPLVLQDDDRLSKANRATSMLHRAERVGMRKARLAASVMEDLGWDSSLIERRYLGGPLRAPGDPAVLLGGVDNIDARRRLDETGLPLIYDAGLGAGPDGFLAMTVRRLPGSRPSREIWPVADDEPAVPFDPAVRGAAYAALDEQTGDRCGVELLAGRSVATAFVGVTAACWVLGGLLRELHGGPAFALVDHSLRDPTQVTTVRATGARLPRVETVQRVPWPAPAV